MTGRTTDQRAPRNPPTAAHGAAKAEIKWGMAEDPDALLGDLMDDFQKAAEEEAARRAAQQRAQEAEAERQRREEEEARQAEVRRRLQEEEDRRRRHERERAEQTRRAQQASAPPPLAEPEEAQTATDPGVLVVPPANLSADPATEIGVTPAGFAARTQAAPQPELPRGPSATERSLRDQLAATRRWATMGMVAAGVLLLATLVMTVLWINGDGELAELRTKLTGLEQSQALAGEQLATAERKLSTLEKEKAALDASNLDLTKKVSQFEQELQDARHLAADSPRTGARRPTAAARPTSAATATRPKPARPLDLKVDDGKGGIIF